MDPHGSPLLKGLSDLLAKIPIKRLKEEIMILKLKILTRKTTRFLFFFPFHHSCPALVLIKWINFSINSEKGKEKMAIPEAHQRP